MNKIFKRTAVIISGLALSLTLLGCGHHKTPEEKAEWITKKITSKLDLNTQQQVNFKQLADQVLISKNAVHENRKQHHEKLLTMLDSPTLDQDLLQGIVSDMTSRVNQQSYAVIDKLAGFYDSLNDQQRAKLREHLAEKMEDGHHRHGW